MTHALKLVTDPPPETAPIADFTDAMSTLASGVALVTCRIGGRPWGTTVTAFASVSADPPTILVSLRSETASARAIERTRRFGVSILAAEQLEVARHGSAPGMPKFLERFTGSGDRSPESPSIDGALAHVDCELSEQGRVGDHPVFLGRVRAARAAPGAAPLVYHLRAYGTLADAGRAPITGRNARCLSS